MSSTESPSSYRKSRKPLQRHQALSIATCIVLFLAFLLFIMVALSMPIIKPLYLLRLDAGVEPGQPETNIATEIRFGVWGLCATSELNAPTWFSNDGYCIGPILGYTLSDAILSLAGDYEGIAKVVLKALTVLLVLHPVVAGLSMLGMFTSLWIASHPMLIFSLIVTIINVILSTVVLAVDIALVVVAKNEVSQLTQYNLTVSFGNAVWIVLVGAIMSWVGLILLSVPVCGCCGVGRKYYAWEQRQVEKAELAEMRELHVVSLC